MVIFVVSVLCIFLAVVLFQILTLARLKSNPHYNGAVSKSLKKYMAFLRIARNAIGHIRRKAVRRRKVSISEKKFGLQRSKTPTSAKKSKIQLGRISASEGKIQASADGNSDFDGKFSISTEKSRHSADASETRSLNERKFRFQGKKASEGKI
jgi:hypothetical protein